MDLLAMLLLGLAAAQAGAAVLLTLGVLVARSLR
jgi:hypothetical protein